MNCVKNISLTKRHFVIEDGVSPLLLNYKKVREKFILDITSLSLIEAVRLSVLCSTYCLINGFKDKLCWLVKDEETRRAISTLRLKNMESMIQEFQVENERVARVS